MPNGCIRLVGMNTSTRSVLCCQDVAACLASALYCTGSHQKIQSRYLLQQVPYSQTTNVGVEFSRQHWQNLSNTLCQSNIESIIALSVVGCMRACISMVPVDVCNTHITVYMALNQIGKYIPELCWLFDCQPERTCYWVPASR